MKILLYFYFKVFEVNYFYKASNVYSSRIKKNLNLNLKKIRFIKVKNLLTSF